MLDKQIEMDIIKNINNRELNELVENAYAIKPFSQDAVDTAKLMKDWFDKDTSLSFDKTIARFLSLSGSQTNPLASYAAYMAAKIYLFNKLDAKSALEIVRKEISKETCSPGIYYIGAYIYQAGLVGEKPNYALACNYLIDSCKFPMPWFESYHVLEKKDASIQVKLHYATKTLKNSTLDEFKKPSFQYLVNYYIKNNYLRELEEIVFQNMNNTAYFEGLNEKIGNALFQLYKYYVSKKDYVNAIKTLENADEIGYDKACETLGLIYFQGTFGVEKDQAKAVEYLQRTKQSGAGKYLLGLCYERGIVVEKNEEKAFELYLKAAKVQFGEALFRLGKIYATGDLKNKDEYLVHRYFEEYLEVEGNKVPEERKKQIKDYYDSFKK